MCLHLIDDLDDCLVIETYAGIWGEALTISSRANTTWLFAVRRWPEDRDLMMRPVCGDPFACPSIAVAGHQSIAVEDAGNQIIIGDEHQLADGRDDIAGRAVALSTAPLWQAQFSMDAANPMDQENDI